KKCPDFISEFDRLAEGDYSTTKENNSKLEPLSGCAYKLSQGLAERKKKNPTSQFDAEQLHGVSDLIIDIDRLRMSTAATTKTGEPLEPRAKSIKDECRLKASGPSRK